MEHYCVSRGPSGIGERKKEEGEHFKDDSPRLLLHAAEDTALQLRAGSFPSRWTDSRTERKMNSTGIKRGTGEEGGRLAGVGGEEREVQAMG